MSKHLFNVYIVYFYPILFVGCIFFNDPDMFNYLRWIASATWIIKLYICWGERNKVLKTIAAVFCCFIYALGKEKNRALHRKGNQMGCGTPTIYLNM